MNMEAASAAERSIEYAPSEIAIKAFELLKVWQIEPTPPAYEVAFLYLTGECREAIIGPIDRMLANGGSISEYDLVQIRQAYHGAEKAGFVDGFKSELDKVLDFIDQQVVKSSKFERRMERQNEAAKSVNSVAQLQRLIGELVEENRKMHHETGKLRSELKKSGSTIQELEKALNDSREKEMLDPLTELGNRRYFDTWLAREVKYAVEEGQPLSLAVADIDNFKRINDSFGHQVGDAVLELFAKVIKSHVRDCDRVARYGGEEFGLIMPQTNLRGAVHAVDRIRREISARSISTIDDKVKIGKVTISIGVAELQRGHAPDDLVQLADSKLYEAKTAGRNRVKF